MFRIGASQAHERLLSGILGVADVAQHLIGEIHQIGVVIAPGRLEADGFVHVVMTNPGPGKLPRTDVTIPAAAPSLKA